jgi:cyclase
MKRRLICLNLMVALATGVAAAQAADESVKIVALRPRLYELTGMGSNSFLYVTKGGAVLVDGKNLDPAAVSALDEAIRGVTTEPVRYLILTHYHQDHVGATKFFAEHGAKVISSEETKRHLLGPEWKTVKVYGNDGTLLREQVSNPSAKMKPTPPNMTVSGKEKTLSVGGEKIRIMNLGAAHTDGDLFVLFPDRAMVVGDDVKPLDGPLIDYPAGGSLSGYIRTMDALLRLHDFDMVLPGHGEVTDRAGIVAHRERLVHLRDEIIRMQQEHKSRTEIADALAKEYGWKAGDRNLGQWTLPGMMKEFTAATPGR